MPKIFRAVILLYIFCLAGASISFALETDTHETINQHIVDNSLNNFSLDQYLRDQLDFPKGIDEKFELEKKRKAKKWIQKGGEYEDKPPEFVFPPRFVNHFHNPINNSGFNGIWGKGFAPGESAVLWSQKSLGTQSPGGHYSWKDVREYFYEALTSGNK
ncbi:MAG: hypothetical protein GY845_38320, partial [Planctomycetes bacterium]|nr:hypothetical protein [Planctomycetota bacterium]